MFSKEWLEQCSQSITSYETPAKGGDMKTFRPGYGKDEDFGVVDDEMEKIVDKKAGNNKIKKWLANMKKRRGEE